MKRELRDELEVPGHVVAIKTMTKGEVVKRLNKIMDGWEQKGWNKIKEIPESNTKQEYRELLTALGFDCKF